MRDRALFERSHPRLRREFDTDAKMAGGKGEPSHQTLIKRAAPPSGAESARKNRGRQVSFLKSIRGNSVLLTFC